MITAEKYEKYIHNIIDDLGTFAIVIALTMYILGRLLIRKDEET